MNKRWEETFRLWSKMEGYKRRIKEARENIRTVLEREKCIVLYSGGKDSSVVLHLCMQIDRRVPVYFFDAGYDYGSNQMKMPMEVTAEIIRNAKSYGAKRIYIHGGKGPSSKQFFGHLVKLKRKLGVEVELLGIRKEESVTRKIRAKNDALIQHEGKRRVCFPIKDLSWMDVWAYIVSNDMQYLSIYDKYVKVLGWDKARFTMLFSKGLMHMGGTYYIDGVLFPKLRNLTTEQAPIRKQ